jgi:hypothetical protein
MHKVTTTAVYIGRHMSLSAVHNVSRSSDKHQCLSTDSIVEVRVATPAQVDSVLLQQAELPD